MRVRLGFAIAIHTHPDILLVDEILAVGDAFFKGKCYNKIRDLQESGVAIVLVSHDAQAMLDRCTRGMLFEQGKIVYNGSISDVLCKYEELLSVKAILEIEKNSDKSLKNPINPLRLSITFEDQNGLPIEFVMSGEPFYIIASIDSDYELEKMFLSIYIRSKEGNLIFNIRNDYYGLPSLFIKKGKSVVKISIHKLDLMPGSYTLSAVGINRSNERPLMNNQSVLLNVSGEKRGGGLINVDAEWIVG